MIKKVETVTMTSRCAKCGITALLSSNVIQEQPESQSPIGSHNHNWFPLLLLGLWRLFASGYPGTFPCLTERTIGRDSAINNRAPSLALSLSLHSTRKGSKHGWQAQQQEMA